MCVCVCVFLCMRVGCVRERMCVGYVHVCWVCVHVCWVCVCVHVCARALGVHVCVRVLVRVWIS